MKILVVGANGFIGRQVSVLLQKEHKVYRAVRNASSDNEVVVDLLDEKTVLAALKNIRPNIVINCAGVVENSEKAKMNVIFTQHLLDAVVKSGLNLNKIIICGSAAEYGIVEKHDISVAENHSLKPNTEYGINKMKESQCALEFRRKFKLPVVVARIFNPIGLGMHERMIIPGILRQAEAIKNGKADTIEVSRLDSRRDYINVKDVATAIKAIVEKTTNYEVYNVGSGVSTSNMQLIQLALKNYDLPKTPKLSETMSEPEPPFATKADISRIKTDLSWQPQCTIEESIKEVFSAARKS